MQPQQVPIRDAATIILLRDRLTRPAVLMGQRGAKAAFMPKKFVFPGGALDAGDASVALASPLPTLCHDRLARESRALPQMIAAAAIRELWEETGLILGQAASWPDAPAAWQDFARRGYRPDAQSLRFFFRAITPEGAPRRFDARFFLADAAALVGDPDDFALATDELSGLAWVPLERAVALDLPFITRVVLSRLLARTQDAGPPDEVPFFRGDAENRARLAAGFGPDQP